MLSPKKLLENARNRIAKRENWNKGAIARDERGYYGIHAASPEACSWCSLGAVYAEAGTEWITIGGFDVIEKPKSAPHPHLQEALKALAGGIKQVRDDVISVAGFNDADSTTHEDVLQAFDNAIDSLRGE